MERITVRLISLLLLCGLGAVDPPTLPSTQPVIAAPTADTNRDRGNRRNRDRGGRDRAPVAVAAADPYAVLRTRSIFVKGNQTITSDVVPGRTPSLQNGELKNRPESALVFNGVINVGDEANAMIEDTGSNKTSLVRQGDLIAVGKVSAISFDDLTYEANGQSKHVSIGQNLAGVVPTPGSAVALTPTTMPSGGAPPGAAPPAAPAAGSSGASAEEILARLKAKRNQEMGIK